MLLLPDTPEFVIAYFAAMKIGAVAVPTNTALRSADYAYFLDESQAAVLVIHSSLYAQVEPVLAGRKDLQHVIVCGETDTWLSSSSPVLEAAEMSKEDAAFWLWTSGSTGMPKAAIHRHQDWAHCCENYACAILGIHEKDITFSSSKLFHAYGLGNALMFPFFVGATTVLYPGRPQAASILDTVQRTKPTLWMESATAG